MRGLAANLSDLTGASSQCDILFCSETLVSDMRYVSELLVLGFGRPVLLCWGKIPRARGMAAYVRGGNGASSMATVQAEDVRESLLWPSLEVVGFNHHVPSWSGSL